MGRTWSFLRRTALVQREADLTDTRQIIGGWEVRRVPDNLIVASRKLAGWPLASAHAPGKIYYH